MADNKRALDEDEVFDRQIRLWGADTQKKLRAARVLVTGRLGGAAAELCKNLVLAGINLTVSDDDAVDAESVSTNVFLRPEDVGKPKAACMLPRMLEMNPFAASAAVAPSATANVSEFSLVVSTGLASDALDAMDAACERAGVPHIYFESAGMYGFALFNLGAPFKYVEKSADKLIEYCALPKLFAASWKDFPKPTKADGRPNNRRFPLLFFAMCLVRARQEQHQAGKTTTQGSPQKSKRARQADATPEETLQRLQREHGLTYELDAAAVCAMANTLTHASSFAPTCAILGGLLGNQVVRVLGRTEPPADNCLFLDAEQGEALIRRVAFSASSSSSSSSSEAPQS